MNYDIVSIDVDSYLINTPVYEGPLDLLLQLIERAELDITKVALAQVTDQYLAYLNAMPDNTVDDVSSFLVIAAKLLQIKSEVLLPRPPVREEGEDDPGDALARQLRIYKRFKELTKFLLQRDTEKYRTYLRTAPVPKIESAVDLGDIALDDILTVAQRVFLKIDKPALGTVVAPPRITIREKIFQISSYLRQHGRGTFRQLLARNNYRLEIVVTFLAMLELVKRHIVRAQQEMLFGDIQIEPNESWSEDEVLELEFGE